MARRPTLENERFWDLPDASLHYIIRDASEAARNMKDMDPKAECKYLDQVNDACTVLATRAREARIEQNRKDAQFSASLPRSQYVGRKIEEA